MEVATGPQEPAVELSDSLFYSALYVSKRVPLGPRKQPPAKKQLDVAGKVSRIGWPSGQAAYPTS